MRGPQTRGAQTAAGLAKKNSLESLNTLSSGPRI